MELVHPPHLLMGTGAPSPPPPPCSSFLTSLFSFSFPLLSPLPPPLPASFLFILSCSSFLPLAPSGLNVQVSLCSHPLGVTMQGLARAWPGGGWCMGMEAVVHFVTVGGVSTHNQDTCVRACK